MIQVPKEPSDSDPSSLQTPLDEIKAEEILNLPINQE